jgi:hypothetical protein
VVVADVDDLHVLGDAASASAEAPVGSEANSTSSFGRLIWSFGRHTGEAVHQPIAGAALARSVDQLERRMARDQAHCLAAAKPADPDANAHGGVLLLE